MRGAQQAHVATVTIRRFVRRMRGGSQAQLVEASDGNFYVAKFLGNPQGNRTLVNELVAHQLLRALEISTPRLRLLNLPNTPELLENAYFSVNAKRVFVQPGTHLGSMCPANPDDVAIFDFLPQRLFNLVGNIEEFATMFVFDRWLFNVDPRQAIFFRDRSRSEKSIFRACFIDHGMSFGGPRWKLGDTTPYGLAAQKSAYLRLDMAALTLRAIDTIKAIPESTIIGLDECIPREWLADGDADCLAGLLGQLEGRRTRLDSVVGRHLDALNDSRNEPARDYCA